MSLCGNALSPIAFSTEYLTIFSNGTFSSFPWRNNMVGFHLLYLKVYAAMFAYF